MSENQETLKVQALEILANVDPLHQQFKKMLSN